MEPNLEDFIKTLQQQQQKPPSFGTQLFNLFLIISGSIIYAGLFIWAVKQIVEFFK